MVTLLAAGAAVRSAHRTTGFTALFYALPGQDQSGQSVAERGSYTHQRDSHGATALMNTAIFHPKTISSLLSAGAHRGMGAKNHHGDDVWSYAQVHSHTPAIKQALHERQLRHLTSCFLEASTEPAALGAGRQRF